MENVRSALSGSAVRFGFRVSGRAMGSKFRRKTAISWRNNFVAIKNRSEWKSEIAERKMAGISQDEEGNSDVTNFDVPLKITGITSSFFLFPDDVKHKLQLSMLCVPGAGEFIERTLEKRPSRVKIQFARQHGKCEIFLNGRVMCSGQLSFEKCKTVAAKVVKKVQKNCDPAAGLHRLSHRMVTAVGELPFHVNLNRLKRDDPGIMFLPDVPPPHAEIRYDDLNCTISVFGSGKLTLFANGDCMTADDAMPKIIKAVARFADFAHGRMIADSEKEVGFSTLAQDMNENRPNFPRRSKRLAKLSETVRPETPAQPKVPLPDTPAELDGAEMRLFQLLQMVQDIHGREALETSLDQILSSEIPPDMDNIFRNVAKYFTPASGFPAGKRNELLIPPFVVDRANRPKVPRVEDDDEPPSSPVTAEILDEYRHILGSPEIEYKSPRRTFKYPMKAPVPARRRISARLAKKPEKIDGDCFIQQFPIKHFLGFNFLGLKSPGQRPGPNLLANLRSESPGQRPGLNLLANLRSESPGLNLLAKDPVQISWPISGPNLLAKDPVCISWPISGPNHPV
ncbi:hypothetical protein BV898_12966 [Hypsibius exemplaris]|uniref:Uncharacterized protein n=1 Tax=Hypsibius exemplaris TaxID=2072580 RepID=A0A1W0WC96_HYPEX|nr:hypothetical protein BV898_12966 [Hypsibius exemplaris]